MQGLVKTCLEMCSVDLTEVYSPALFNERSMQLGLNSSGAAELENACNLFTKSGRDKRSSELRIAKPKVLHRARCYGQPQKRNIGKSNQLESTESTVITTRSRLIFAVRECFEQVYRGDHFVFEHPSIASCWNELCVQKFVTQRSVFSFKKLKDPCVAGICCRATRDLRENLYRG